jgi:hypothetical protein
LAFVVVMLGVTAVHEVGHLLAGRLARLQFYLLIIGPMQLRRINNRLQLGWQRGLGFFNGMAACLPHSSHRLRQRMMLFAAGGPLASLALALLAAGLAAQWRQRPLLYRDAAWLWEMAVLTAVVSAIFFLTTFRPGRYPNGFMTDGGRLALLLQNGQQAQRWCALLLLNMADVKGVRPRSWDEALVQQTLLLADHSYDGVMARLLAYQQALDKNELAQAAVLIDEALASQFAWVGGMQMRLLLEKAYLLARHEQDPQEATRLLPRLRTVPQQIVLPYHRVKTAVFLSMGQGVPAAEAAQAGLHIGRGQAEMGGVWQAEMALLAQLADEAEQLK